MPDPIPAPAPLPALDPHPSSLLAGLGILGWDDREAAVVAALATEAPLLLVGPHGTAKSLLLERLAAALGLEMRHYNASILNFDDLVGFPVPDGDQVRYLRTPLDAWDAEAVFVDELSRCRPEMQNRLFPLVHERRLQGRTLDRLRHRWAAMNPPEAYAGTESLDAALADRFPWLLETPPTPRGDVRRALIDGPVVAEDGAARLRAAVERTRGGLAVARAVCAGAAVAYVDAVADALAQSDLELSGRRLRMLHDNIVAVVATGMCANVADAALLALTWSLPRRAAEAVPTERILAAHVVARHFLARPDDVVRRALLAERDPVRRVGIALAHDDDTLLGATLLDTRSALARDERFAFGAHLFPWLAHHRPGIPGIAFEALAAEAGQVEAVAATSREGTPPVRRRAAEVSRVAAGLGADEAWIRRALWAAFEAEALPAEPGRFVVFARGLARRLPLPETR